MEGSETWCWGFGGGRGVRRKWGVLVRSQLQGLWRLCGANHLVQKPLGSCELEDKGVRHTLGGQLLGRRV